MNPDMNEQTKKRLKAALLEEQHGTAKSQKDNLVRQILSAFESPDKWPMTDAERCQLLKNLYSAATLLRHAEPI